ncbi:lysylphosphatidylglycerol synthase transmembrane domain-containing protein [Robiginitalea aurantiaca]|uniref:Lysylphosphatidylglycerol synthase transmembrane domain-containing protein n=1 Tax=Robiginitalea aurantiaca TaxID=3056915 RepID=A0ABT7WEG6_9FLAO|nr:lysylphosphatidylglycerol synthase transmembrane domain-containing protein [Robiginitalea aurantiaca]MDM9631307.1 lysylphosphatidylglycerol synthase transmembrane domain-containing protein [Robiginitalea aurantiaca]
MKTRTKKALKTILPIALGVSLVAYSYLITSPEDRSQIVKYIREADPLWVLLSLGIGFLSHLSRAIRWNYLLEPMGYHPRVRNNLLLVLSAYFANLGIPRSGEVLRATGLSTYEGVPFQKGFGTIVTERVIDVIMLLIVILIALFSQTKIISGYLQESGLGLGSSIAIIIVGVGGLFGVLALLKRASNPFFQKLRDFLRGLLEGVMSIFHMRRKWAFIGHTLFIWTCYVGMFWVIKYTIPETVSLNFGQLLVAFVAGAFAMSATNGGIGLYPIAVSKAITLFGISAVSGDAFGWIMWIAQTLMVVLFGTISFLLLPLWNRDK